MNEIKCPHCGKTFKVDESSFADILKQVRDSEFDKALHEQVENALKIANLEAQSSLKQETTLKDIEISDLKAKLREKDDEVKLVESQTKNVLQEDLAKKNSEIAALQQKLEGKETEKQLAVTEALSKIEKERDDLIAQLRSKEEEAKLIESETKNTLQEDISKKNAEIATLQAKLEAKETEKRLAITEAINKIERERDELSGKLESKDSEKKLLEVSLKDKYETELKSKDEMIAYYKDMKARLSTKMVGETLEQHCEIEFEKLRATGFKNAVFGKDNDSTSGSKGDYIYREYDDQGNEIISIMFEMKNEGDETATKKKNDDFLKELDKDRSEKKCEYAVLVTLLEAENELYNTGIVDVSHKFEKMYVVRPQFFIPIITILRNAALNSMQYKSELALIRSQNIDITNFENDLETFKEGFSRNYELAGRKFSSAIQDIDKTISLLQRTKEELLSSDNNLRLANNKIQDVTVKRLTRDNPTMAEKFSDLNSSEEKK